MDLGSQAAAAEAATAEWAVAAAVRLEEKTANGSQIAIFSC